MKQEDLHRSKKIYQWLSAALALVLLATGVFTYNTYNAKQEYQTFLQNNYQRSFRELITNVENIKILLDKAEVSASPVQSSALFSQVWQQSFSASKNLGEIPGSFAALSKTEKYLNQVGDFCYTLSVKGAADKRPDEKQMTQVGKLRDYAATLLNQLYAMEQDVANGKITFAQVGARSQPLFRKAPQSPIDINFTKLDEKFSEYPTMIYDGPFSDHVVSGKAKGLKGEAINIQKAKEIATKFIGADKIASIREYSSGKGNIDTFGLEVAPKNKEQDGTNIYIDVTKKGGHVLWLLNSRFIPEENLTSDQAVEKAKKFLKQQGFDNLVETYFLKNDNNLVITFVGVEKNGTLVYPDLLKVKVALDNGEVIGFDAFQYLMSHRDRKIYKPSITEAQARAKVNEKIQIERVKLAIIPLPGDREVFCYEFKGKFQNNDYFVYINAENGNEENILRIINAENGTLTQ